MSTSTKRVGFAEAFMRERARYQVSRSDIARFVGVDQSVIKRWERGKSVPSTVQWKRLLCRLPRIAPFVPDWGSHSDGVLDGSADEFRADMAALMEKNATKLDATEKPPIESFADGLRRVREENEVTQDELAEVLGLTGQSVSQWETETCAPVIPNLAKLFELLPELRAGIETGAIKRPPSQSISVPVGARGYQRASTVDSQLDAAIKAECEHQFKEVCDTDPAHDPTRSMTRVVCSICGESKPPSPRSSEVRLVKAEHEHKVRRCPCGGAIAGPTEGKMAPWVCLKCQRELYTMELIEAYAPQLAETEAGRLAEAYARALVEAARARQREYLAQEALTNAATARRNAEQEVDEALALLEIAVTEESSR